MTPILGITASSITSSFLGGDFESIATVTVGSGGAADVTFTSITQDFQHLQIRVLAQAGSVGLNMQLNGVTSGYSAHYFTGNGTTTSASGSTGESYIFVGRMPTSTHFGVAVIDILDYSSAAKYTTVRSIAGTDANGSGSAWAFSGLYQQTTEVTSLKLLPTSGNFSEFSHFALYGIRG